MAKDNATEKDIKRRVRARIEYEERKANFPDHVLRKQPDGTYLSDPMVFDVSRWGGRHQKETE